VVPGEDHEHHHQTTKPETGDVNQGRSFELSNADISRRPLSSTPKKGAARSVANREMGGFVLRGGRSEKGLIRPGERLRDDKTGQYWGGDLTTWEGRECHKEERERTGNPAPEGRALPSPEGLQQNSRNYRKEGWGDEFFRKKKEVEAQSGARGSGQRRSRRSSVSKKRSSASKGLSHQI